MGEYEGDDECSNALEVAIAQAESFKAQGNEAFKEKKYDEAIRYYSQAIDLDPENAVYYSNRSAAYLAEGDSKSKALKDAEKCIELKPEWAKAYSRKGAAEFALTRFDAARMTYVQALKLDPDNKEIEEALEETRQAQERKSAQLKEHYKLQEQYEKEQEAKRQMEKEAKEKAEKEARQNISAEDEILNSFMAEVQEIEERVTCTATPKENVEKAPVDFGTSEQQVNRLTQMHFEWINLNPFGVLLLDIDATEEDIKKHFRKLSSMVHPDKCSDPRARDAFEEVKKAHIQLQNEDRRNLCIKTIENATEKVLKERRQKMKKGMTEAELGDEKEAIKKMVMATFAEFENRRRNLETREAAQRKRESDQQEEAQEKMVKDYKREREWAKADRREKRVGTWRDFAKEGKKTKTVGAPGWKAEARV